VDIKDGLNALLPVARTVFGLETDALRRLGPADLTILFTDIENYTVIADTHGDEAAQSVLRAHNAVVRRVLKQAYGQEIKHTGDGIMAYFRSATQAVTAAVAIQRGIATHNAEAAAGSSGATEMKLRVGLNAGEPILEDGDLYGTPVIVAARVADLARGGQILVTDVVRQLVAGKGFVFEALGDACLQGISETVAIYAVVCRDNAARRDATAWGL